MHERFDGKGMAPLPFVGFALLALLIGAFAVSCGGTAAERDSPDEQRASVELDRPTLGDENAPVVLTEYANYQ